MAALDHNAFRGMLRSSTVKKVHAKNVIIDRGIMAALDHNAFRGMLRSSTVKKVRAQNVIVDREREKISTSSSGHKHAIGTEEETHKRPAATARTPSAVSKALHTTEILELILSHVPAFDLIAAANVNDLFYNCAVNSPIIQQTLLLRSGINAPPQCYRIHRSWTGSDGREVRSATNGLAPSAGMSSDDNMPWAEPCTAMRLCPALGPLDYYAARENIGTPSDGLHNLRLYGNAMLVFTAAPVEVGRLDMFVSSPPVTGVSIFLCYRHVRTPAMVIINYTSAHDCPLTFNSIFEGAWSATNGSIVLVEGADVRGPGVSTIFTSDTTLDAVTSEYIEDHGGSFALDLKRSWIKLNAIVPTEEEREAMRETLSEEEKKKKKIDTGHYAAWMAKLLGNR